MTSTAMAMDANSDSWALEPKYCVNPYEISTTHRVPAANVNLLGKNIESCPLNGLVENDSARKVIARNSIGDFRSLVNISALKSEVSPTENTCLVKSEVSHSATTSPEPITDLESFQDLTVWCQAAQRKPNMSWQTETDELNTPIIELGEFLFTTPTTTLDNTNDDCYGLLSVSNGNIPDIYTYAGSTGIQSTKYDINYHSSVNKSIIMDINKSEIYQYLNVHDNENGEGNGIERTEPIKPIKYTNSDNININRFKNMQTEYSSLDQQLELPNVYAKNMATSSNDTYQHLNVFTFSHQSSSETEMDHSSEPVATDRNVIIPTTSTQNTSLPTTSTLTRPQLKLDFNNIKIENKNVSMDTPEIINAALDLDKEFNLVNFINNEGVFAEELSLCASSPSCDADDVSQTVSVSNDPPSEFSSISTDDEDYEPPWKKNKSTAKKLKKTKSSKPKSKLINNFINIGKRESYDSEVSNISTAEVNKVVRRGRPPKRNISISSESNADGSDVSRYRELRDKNNEASRRSRFNRKLKELQLEEEGKDLDSRNRKLKVQVEELEKLVNTMRTNLMQMLLKK